MDMIQHSGGQPANFLDIGGGASPERVATAIELVLWHMIDPNPDRLLQFYQLDRALIGQHNWMTRGWLIHFAVERKGAG